MDKNIAVVDPHERVLPPRKPLAAPLRRREIDLPEPAVSSGTPSEPQGPSSQRDKTTDVPGSEYWLP